MDGRHHVIREQTTTLAAAPGIGHGVDRVPKRTSTFRNGRGTRVPGRWIWSVPTRPVGTICAPVAMAR